MFSLQDFMGQDRGNAAVGEIASNVGAEPSTVNSAIQAALPMILRGIANNASKPDGPGGLLGGGHPQPASSGNAIFDMASSMLDRYGDGCSMDDTASMAMNYFNNG